MKELRLRHISTPAAGNDYLPEFCVDYNQRFGREPQSAHDAHRPLRDQDDLDLIFTRQDQRKISRNLTFQYKRVMYLVKPGSETLALAGERCCVHEYRDGRVEARHAGRLLPCEIYFEKDPNVQQGAIVTSAFDRRSRSEKRGNKPMLLAHDGPFTNHNPARQSNSC